MNTSKKTFYYFSAILFFASFSCYFIFGMIDYSKSHILIALFWMTGFAVLTLNVCYMLVSTLVACFSKPSYLQEQISESIPPTAIIYIVRNEHPEVLKTNLKQSLEKSADANSDLWLLSNSDLDDYVEDEKNIIDALQQQYGKERVAYFQTYQNPLRRKHICIQQWLSQYQHYRYAIVCDADSILPKGSLSQLVAKAEHPDNRDIVLFQSKINIAKGNTYFARFLGHGQDICQRIYAYANQKVFGRGVSYGSGCLIRCAEFRTIDVPDWVLSHDIWDTVLLEEKGYRVVFCPDVVTYGSFPGNYIEYLKRSKRWIKGTLESFPVAMRKNISPGTRFMVVYPVYMYSIQPLFLLWIFSGFFYNPKMWDSLFVVQKYAFLGGSLVDMEMGSHLFVTMSVVAGHRFVKCRNIQEIRSSVMELFATVLLCLNNIIFDSVTVVKWLLVRKKGLAWVSMKKDPNISLSLLEVAKVLWPVSLMGLICLLMGLFYNPLWCLAASPFLCSFILGIPIAYLTGKKAGSSIV
ncbi:MAG: glycosyltransferase [Chlamydiota bacterium]|nr:glycosyltransferase [Chlamydiota bacterium]